MIIGVGGRTTLFKISIAKMIGVMYLEIRNAEAKHIKVNDTGKKDDTKITTQMLTEQERLSVQIVDSRKEITELTKAELKELENGTKQFKKGSFRHSRYLRMNYKHRKSSKMCQLLNIIDISLRISV